jgi:hypothetical protein
VTTPVAGGVPFRDERGTERADEWEVRPVAGAFARKSYRCPGCDQEIQPGQPHVVAWPTGLPDERRHWHRVCWEARSRRAPTGRR